MHTRLCVFEHALFLSVVDSQRVGWWRPRSFCVEVSFCSYVSCFRQTLAGDSCTPCAASTRPLRTISLTFTAIACAKSTCAPTSSAWQATSLCLCLCPPVPFSPLSLSLQLLACSSRLCVRCLCCFLSPHRMLRYEDSAYFHRFYFAAAARACDIYAQLHDHPFGSASKREEVCVLASACFCLLLLLCFLTIPAKRMTCWHASKPTLFPCCRVCLRCVLSGCC